MYYASFRHLAVILFMLLIIISDLAANAQSVIKNGGFEEAGALVNGFLPGVRQNEGTGPRNVTEAPTGGDIYVLTDDSTAIKHWQAFATADATIDWVHETAIDASAGVLSVDLNGTPGPGGIWQGFRTIPGFEYKVTFDMASNPSVLGLQSLSSGTITNYTTMLDMGVQGVPATATDFSYAPTSSTSFSHSISQGTHSIANPGWETKGEWTFTATDELTALAFNSLKPKFDRDVSGLPPEEQAAAALQDYGPLVDNVSVQFVGDFLHWVPLTAGNAECCVMSDNWTDPTSWSEDPAFGGPRRVPTADDIVLIDASMFATNEQSSYTAVLNTNATVKKLVIASPADGIRVSGSRTLEVLGGEIQNHGFIHILSGSSLALRGLDAGDGIPQLSVENTGQILIDAISSSTDLQVDGSVGFSGNGNVTLNGSGSGNFDRIVSVLDGPSDVLTNGWDHTIRGGGRIGIPASPLGIVNQGVIEGSIGSLRIDPDNVAGLINTGTLRATGGGVLQLEEGTFDSRDGGLIHAADGSIVSLGQNGRILGGTITTEGTGRVGTIGNGVDPIFAGTITNHGQIELDTVNANADLRIDGEVTLSGGG